MGFLLERDSINGKDGKAFLIEDGSVNQLFRIKTLKAEGNFQESDFKVVGTRIIQIKTNGIKYTGTMDIYYGTPIFNRMLIKYQDEGKLPYFTIQIVNDDQTATVGKQTVSLSNCKFNKIPIAMLDADSDALVEQTGFSFTRVEVLNEFKDDPDNYG